MSESGTGVRALDEVARLLVEGAEAADRRRPRGIRVRGPAWRLVPRFALGALVAGALIAGLVVLAFGGDGAGERPVPAAAPDEHLGPGEYWYTRTTYGGYHGPNSTTEVWLDRRGLGQVRTTTGNRVRYSAVGGRPSSARPGPLGTIKVVLDYPAILRLPADPARLRERLLRIGRHRTAFDLVTVTGSLIAGPYPVPKPVRLALVEMLSSEPDIRVDSRGLDELQRSGVEFQTKSSRGFLTTLIVDPATGKPLSSETVDEKGKSLGFGLYEEARITRSLGVPAGAGIDVHLVASFGIFRRPQQPGDVPPRGERRFGVDPDLLDFANARRATITRAGRSVYIVPGRGFVCMTGAGCSSISLAAVGQGSYGYSGCNPTTVFALLPDRVRSPRVLDGKGREHPGRFTNNAFVAEVRAPGPLTIVWETEKGDREAKDNGRLTGCP